MSYVPKVYKKDGGNELVVADGGTLTIESGGTLTAESGATMSLPDISLEVGDLALASAKIVVGNAQGVAAAVALSGDATIDNAGALTIGTGAVEDSMIEALADGEIIIGVDGTAANNAKVTVTGDVVIANDGTATIQAGAVESSMLANGAGLAALIAAGLGASAAYDNTTSGAQTLLASDVSGRVALIVVVVDESFADGDGGQSEFTVGETDTADKFAASTVFADATAGDIFVLAGTLTAAKALLVTGTAATGTGTGGISVSALVLPAAA